MVPEQPYIVCLGKKSNLDLSHTLYKNYLKMDHRLQSTVVPPLPEGDTFRDTQWMLKLQEVLSPMYMFSVHIFQSPFNAFSILTKHLSHTVAKIFAV